MVQWFGPKTSGNGVGPRSWQGWLATAIFLAILIGSRFIPFETLGLPPWFRAALSIGAIVTYLLLMCLTYEADEYSN